MKRILAILAALVLCPVWCLAEVDLTGMAYDDLVALDATIHQELAARSAMEDPNNEISRMLYEDERVSIEFSGIRTEETSYDTYLYTEYLIKNKTDRILYLVCESIIVDGCAVDISKYVEVPPNSMTIHEWTNDAEQYLKYKIEKPTNLSMMFDYKATDNSFKSGTLISETLNIKE